MNRPPSIVLFEKLYLAAIVVGIVNTFVSWSQVNAMLDDPRVQAAGMGNGTLVFALFVGILIPFLLWYFIARRASNVAKWVLVVLTALGLFGFLSSLANPLAPKGLAMILGAVALVLQLYAAWLLFRPDAKAWLESKGVDAAGEPTPLE